MAGPGPTISWVALRALIVDDSPGFRSSAAVLLRAGGVEIAGEASTGAEALDAVAALRPDVVLLDIRLPDGDGFAVCRRLVAAGIPVVLCSTRAARDYGDRVTASGATGFLLKERLSAAELLRLLGRG